MMQIVTDTGMDLYLPPEKMPEIPIHIVPHTITLDGKTYRSGEDIRPEELQQKLLATESFPITSTPSSGEFAAIQKKGWKIGGIRAIIIGTTQETPCPTTPNPKQNLSRNRKSKTT